MPQVMVDETRISVSRMNPPKWATMSLKTSFGMSLRTSFELEKNVFDCSQKSLNDSPVHPPSQETSFLVKTESKLSKKGSQNAPKFSQNSPECF